MSDLVKKTKVVPFINTGTTMFPTWTQIKKSTSFTLAMNPQTQTFDFISDEIPQNEIDRYQPSLAQSLTMFKGEDDYQTIFDMLFERATGEDAHREVLIAFYKETASYKPSGESNPATVYKAWKVDATVTLNQMDTVNENIDFDLAFNSITEGAVSVSGQGVPSFTKGSFTKAEGGYTFVPDGTESESVGA